MAFESFKKALGNLRYAIEKAQQGSVILADANARNLDFQTQRRAQIAKDVLAAISALEREAKVLHALADEDAAKELKVLAILKIIRVLKEARDLGAVRDAAHELRNALTDLEQEAQDAFSPIPAVVHDVPAEIRHDIESDLAELRRCFDAECYRSVVILCGRLLETALHRKYFEATGTDLMEKAPGTGLGNLIRKLSEQNVTLDPGLTNQIHLVNQVRVSSVHVKKDAFNPSKNQAHAVALYTVDVLKKLF